MDIKPKNKVNSPQSETNAKAPVPDVAKTVAGFVMSEEIRASLELERLAAEKAAEAKALAKKTEKAKLEAQLAAEKTENIKAAAEKAAAEKAAAEKAAAEKAAARKAAARKAAAEKVAAEKVAAEKAAAEKAAARKTPAEKFNTNQDAPKFKIVEAAPLDSNIQASVTSNHLKAPLQSNALQEIVTPMPNYYMTPIEDPKNIKQVDWFDSDVEVVHEESHRNTKLFPIIFMLTLAAVGGFVATMVAQSPQTPEVTKPEKSVFAFIENDKAKADKVVDESDKKSATNPKDELGPTNADGDTVDKEKSSSVDEAAAEKVAAEKAAAEKVAAEKAAAEKAAAKKAAAKKAAAEKAAAKKAAAKKAAAKKAAAKKKRSKRLTPKQKTAKYQSYIKQGMSNFKKKNYKSAKRDWSRAKRYAQTSSEKAKVKKYLSLLKGK